MKSCRSSVLIIAVVVTILTSSLATAQLTAEKIAATNKILQQTKATISKMSPSRQMLLGGYANISNLADRWPTYGMRMLDPSFSPLALAPKGAPTPADNGHGLIPVSNPATDIAFSAFGGFTQSTTSTARCGDSVVVGYDDSGSVFETPFFFTGTGGESLSGSSYSSDGGRHFTDIGPINPGPTLYNFLGGDPVVTCADAHTFYVSQIFLYDDANLNPFGAIAVNASTDGGKTWNDPVAAIAKSGLTHVLDKPWSAIDPSNHKRMFVSYTDFDYSMASAACGSTTRTAIEFVESDDGGVTWSSTPQIAIQVCGSADVDGSQIVVSSKGTVYVSWVNYGSNAPLGPRTIQISSYASGKLSAPVTVEPALQPGGDSYYLQGEFHDGVEMAMAIDHSGTSTDGFLYITWADGRDKTVSDPFALQGFYAYDDVLLRASYDGGNTWGGPVKVNSDFQSHVASGHDHYQPGVAVDNHGRVAVCWYDRRADWENFAIRRHCGVSSTDGTHFSDNDIGLDGFAPTHGNDLLIGPAYMGDYDQLTSDFLNSKCGFIGSFQTQTNRGNPDVLAYSIE